MTKSTCILVLGSGRIRVRYLDVWCYCGWPLHVYGRSWWWAEALCNIPEG